MMDMMTMTMALQMALDRLIETDNAIQRDEHDREAAVMAVIDVVRSMKAEQPMPRAAVAS
jgi:hypothetical protein